MINNINEKFLEAATQGDTEVIKYLLEHEYGYAIHLDDNDFEPLKLIEKKAKKILEYVLLKRVKEEGRIQNGNYYIDANTYYCKLSPENQKNEKLALSILIHGNEYLNIIHEELKTPNFLNKLAKSTYKRNIFDFDFSYTKGYKNFLINYIANGNSLSKKVILDQQLLEDRNFIYKISEYKCNLFSFIEHIYYDDMEIMKNIALNEDNTFSYMRSSVRNKLSKDQKTALALINMNPNYYTYLNKDIQLNDIIINQVLALKPAIYEVFQMELKNDVLKTIEYVKNYNIDVKFLSDTVKVNKEIATIMTQRDGNNLEYFPLYKEDKQLIDLALQTSKRLSLLPKQYRTDEKIKEIVLQASLEENSFNLHYLPKTVKENNIFVLELIKKDKLFKEDIFALVNDYGHHKNDYEIVKECIKKHNDLYGRFFNFKEDYEIIHIYIESMKKQMNGIYAPNLIPAKIKAEASMNNAPLDKYVLNKTIEKKSQDWNIKHPDIKSKKIKI